MNSSHLDMLAMFHIFIIMTSAMIDQFLLKHKNIIFMISKSFIYYPFEKYKMLLNIYLLTFIVELSDPFEVVHGPGPTNQLLLIKYVPK